MRESYTKATKLFDNSVAEASAKPDTETSPRVLAVECDMQVIADTAMSPSNEEQPRKPQAIPKQKHKKGKRKGKRAPNNESTNAENASSGVDSAGEQDGNAEAMYSNEEDAQMENMLEGVEAENSVKLEERKRIHDQSPWES